jgi:hypothetical protein
MGEKMKPGLKTNKLIIKWNREALNSNYDFIRVSSKVHYPFGKIVDDIFELNSVCSVRYDGYDRNDSQHKNMYVMLEKRDNNRNIVRNYLADRPEIEWTHEFLHPSEIKEYILAQLLFNSLSRFEINEAKYNNITGGFFYVAPAWARGKRLKTLKFNISPPMELSLNAVGFTYVSAHKEIIFKKGKGVNDYTQYVLGNDFSLRKSYDKKSKKRYIRRPIGNERARINFLDMRGIEKYKTCKNNALEEVVTSFNRRYSGMANVDFERYSFETMKSLHLEDKKKLKERVQKIIEQSNIVVIDAIGDEKFKWCCDDLQSLIETEYNITVGRSDDVVEGALNICVLHNKEFYEENNLNDPYQKFKDASLQHITVELIEEDPQFAVKVLMNELIIKQDIIDGKVTIDDWAARNFKGYSIFVAVSEEDENELVKMCVRPDGTFDICHHKRGDIFSGDEYVKIFETKDNSDKTLIGVIINERGEINSLHNTDLFTIPENDAIRAQLEKNNSQSSKGLRTNEFKERNLQACLDIQYCNHNSHAYYCVGVHSSDLGWVIPNACLIREVRPHHTSRLFFDDILQLMLISFVKYNRMSVLPFPFKYIREYSKSHIKKINTSDKED